MVKRPTPARASALALNPLGYLATQDLKGRGWTPRLIATFLGTHDEVRPNGLKMGRRRLPPVKLYLETRVEEAEREEAFLLAQHRAMQAREKAAANKAEREQRRADRIEALASAYRPTPQPQEGVRKGAVRKAREAHLPALERAIERVSAELVRAEEGPSGAGRPRKASASRKAAKVSTPKPGAPLSEAETKTLRATLLRRLDAALSQIYSWFPHPDAAAGPPSHAQPADWRTWDWD